MENKLFKPSGPGRLYWGNKASLLKNWSQEHTKKKKTQAEDHDAGEYLKCWCIWGTQKRPTWLHSGRRWVWRHSVGHTIYRDLHTKLRHLVLIQSVMQSHFSRVLRRGIKWYSSCYKNMCLSSWRKID